VIDQADTVAADTVATEPRPVRTAAAEIDRLGMKLSGSSLIAMGFVIETELARQGDAAIVPASDHKCPKCRLYMPKSWLKGTPAMRTAALAILATALALGLAAPAAAGPATPAPLVLDAPALERVTAAGSLTIIDFGVVTWSSPERPTVTLARAGTAGFAVGAVLSRSFSGDTSSSGLALSIVSVRP